MKYKVANEKMDSLLRNFFTAEQIDKTIELYKDSEFGIVHFNMSSGKESYLLSFPVREVIEVGGEE